MKIKRIKIAILFLVLIKGICISAQQNQKDNKSTIGITKNLLTGQDLIGKKMPSLVAKGLDGNVFIGQSNQRIIFYHFWFSSCSPCLTEIPLLNKLQIDYKERVDFVAITFDSEATILETLKKHPFNFNHYRFEKEDINRLAFIRGYPMNLIVVDGIIVYCQVGGTDLAQEDQSAKTEQTLTKYKEVLNSHLN